MRDETTLIQLSTALSSTKECVVATAHWRKSENGRHRVICFLLSTMLPVLSSRRAQV